MTILPMANHITISACIVTGDEKRSIASTIKNIATPISVAELMNAANISALLYP